MRRAGLILIRPHPRPQVTRGRLWNGGDVTPGRSFGFRSKEYADITTVYAGTSTAVGPGYLEDAAGTWFAQQYAGFELVVSSGTVRTLTGSSVSPPRLTFAGVGDTGRGRVCRPQSTANGGVGFLSYLDSANGGYGSVLFEVSFDSGAHWLTLYETGSWIGSGASWRLQNLAGTTSSVSR